MSTGTENQYHLQAPGCFSRILGNRDTATAVWDEPLGYQVLLRSTRSSTKYARRPVRCRVPRPRPASERDAANPESMAAEDPEDVTHCEYPLEDVTDSQYS